MNPLELIHRWRYAAELSRKLDVINANVLDALRGASQPRSPPPPPDHFVQLIAFGLVELGERGAPRELVRVVGGAAGVVNAAEPSRLLSFDVYRPTRSLELLVFCDLSKVAVDGLFLGLDLVSMNLASGAPIGFAALAVPGQRIGATVRLRGA